MVDNLLESFGDKASQGQNKRAPVDPKQKYLPGSWSPVEYRKWQFFVHNETLGKNDDYFNTMALAYACATKKMDAIQFLLEKRNASANGSIGLMNEPLFAVIDYVAYKDQVEIAKLLKKHDVLFTYEMSGRRKDVAGPLYKFMDDPSADDELNIVPDYLENSPLMQMNDDQLHEHMNVLALSYAFLMRKVVEADFLLAVRNVSMQGSAYLIDEPAKIMAHIDDRVLLSIAAAHGFETNQKVSLLLNQKPA